MFIILAISAGIAGGYIMGHVFQEVKNKNLNYGSLLMLASVLCMTFYYLGWSDEFRLFFVIVFFSPVIGFVINLKNRKRKFIF